MDVKFINPFLYGTAEVLSKMAFISPVAGKPYAKTDDAACGDVSGIIGMTGDAVGSLALTFTKDCIIYIVGKMLGEAHTEMNKEVMDAVGELTNMISGAARKLMEKENLTVVAAIPTIVYGRAHTVRHVLRGPSIVIPFKTDGGEFVIDICLQSQIKKQEDKPAQQRKTDISVFETKAAHPAVFAKPSMPQAGTGISQEKIDHDLGKANIAETKDPGERITLLRQVLTETIKSRDSIVKQLKDQPFMEMAQRQRYKNALPAYDSKIKRLKLDITAAETILKMSKEDFDNPQVKPHYQHYPTSTKPENKK
jgi:chemotaxis protein CheX